MDAGVLPARVALAGWRLGTLPALAAGLAALGLLFHAEAVAAVGVWIASTAYGHCFFVIPIAAWLAWDRRERVAATPIRTAPVVALAALPAAALWLLAERLGIMEARQLLALACVELLFVAVLGWQMARALAAPLLYLAFLVPAGAFIVPALQGFTAGFIDVGLVLLGIPHFSSAYTIEIPEGVFYVAEACAGLRFLIAAVAFGVLYACMMYRGTGRRLAFVAVSVVIPIVANGLRGLGIVALGHYLGSAEAAATDHVLYGWMFFSIVILLLVLAGLPFRDGPALMMSRLPVARMRAGGGRALLAAALVATTAAVGPATASLLDRRAGPLRADATMPALAMPPGCRIAATERAGPPGWRVVTHVACAQDWLDVAITGFAPTTNPAALLLAARAATAEQAAEEAESGQLASGAGGAPSWRLVETAAPAQLTATALWVDGQAVPDGIALRQRQARNSLFGSAYAPVLVAVSVISPHGRMTPAERGRARALIVSVVQAQPALAASITALSAQLAE